MRRLANASLLLLVWALTAPAVSREKIKLMYLEGEQETRAAVLLGRLELPLEVHRVGIFRVGSSYYGVVRFGAVLPSGELADHHRIAATAATICDRIFGEIPNLVRIDFEGVSLRETKTVKPDVLFSASIDRSSWKTIDKKSLSLERIRHTGALYFDPRLSIGEPSKPKAKAKVGKPVKPNKIQSKPAVKKTPTRDAPANRESK